MKKSERLKPRIKIKFKYFILANILTLFFAVAHASPAGGPVALAADKSAEEAGNFFNFNPQNAYSEPFSKLIEFLNDKKNELEKYDDDFLSGKALLIDTGLRGSKSGVDEAELNLDASSFLASVLGSVKDTMKNVFDSAKSFVFQEGGQNDFEYNSPSSESARQEMENLKQQYAEAIDETKAISQKFNLLQNEMEKIKNSGVVVRQPVIEQKTVEKTIEKIVSGLSQTDLDSGLSNLRTELNNLNTNLLNQINTLSANSNRQTSAVYQAVSLTNKIDSLSGTRLTNITVSGVSGLADSDIPDTITASSYLPLAGGTLTGALTGTTASFSSTLTVSASTTLNGVEYKWPSADGTANQALVTNGAGGLSWTTISSGTSADWVKETNYGGLTLTASTTIPYWAKGAIYASSTSVFQGLATFGNASTSVLSVSGNASTTNLVVSANSTLGTVTSGVWNGTVIGLTYGGTGQTSFGQGWLNSDGTTITASTSPTVNYITATSTTATSTFANLAVATQLKIGSDYITDITGANLSIANGVLSAAGGSSASDFTFETNYGGLAAATSSSVWLKNPLYASSTSVFQGLASFANATATQLTLTNLYIGGDRLDELCGTGLTCSSNTLALNATGDWTGTLDGQEGTYYLARANHTGTQGVATLSNYDWTFLNNYGAINLTATSTKPLWAQGGINASSTSNFVYASTTALTVSGNSYLGTVSSGAWNGTAIGAQYGGTGLDSSALTGIAQIVSGTWSASSTLSAAFGGTGWGNLQANTVLLGNGAGRLATTSAGTDGYVLGLSAGVPTWLATSTLSTITGTLAVGKGGTGQTSFGQGWLNSNGTDLSASTSPTVNYIVATSTTATSTFPYLSVTTNSNLGTVVGGTWQGTAVGTQYGGTGQNFSASSGLVNFYSGTASTIATSSLGLLTTNVAEGTNQYWTNDRFDNRLSATTTLPNLTTLLGLINATTTGITSTNSWLGTIRSGTWNGTAISNQYGGTGLDSSALTGIAQIVAGTWSASSTLSTAFGGTGWGNLQANTVLLGNGAGRISTTTAGTDGYVLGLSAGVPTWLATSTLSTITGTLAVAKGGTGATTLTGLLQGNGTSAITGIAGTAGQFPYYNGTDTLLATSSLFLATSGNVGIGTTTPDSKLTVFNSAGDSAIEFSSASGSTYKWTIGMDYSDAGKFKIASSTVLGSIDRFTIDGNGYVGIGTSTPARRLDVADSGNNNPQMRLSRETNVYTDFSVVQTTGDLSLALYGTNADDISLFMPDGSTGANLWVCEGAACPNGISFTGGGNLFVEGVIKYATSTTPKTRRSIILTAAGAIVPTSGGAAKTQVDGTNHSYYVLDYDASSDETAYWQWTMPDSYDNGSIDITYYWEAGATSGDAILCFQAKGLSANSSEDIDSALSSAVCETDTAQANANDLASITETNATSNFTAGEYITFKVFRDADVAGDTMTGDARLVKVKIEYGVATESD